MTTGLILIVAVLVLGGVIASVGDRIGTKVGKARLSLFNLRPKNTAVLITLLTGSLISGSTLAVLFAASDQLRTGVFRLGTIQRNLKNARQEVEKTKGEKLLLEAEKFQVEQEKSQVQNELAQAKAEQAEAQKRLDDTNKALQMVLAKLSQAVAKQAHTEAQLNQTQGQLTQTQGQLSQTQEQLKVASQQTENLRGEITKLQSERKELIAQKDQVQQQITQLKAQLDQRDEKIAARDRTIRLQDEQIAVRDTAINQRDQRIRTQDQRIYQREQEIGIRAQKMRIQDQVIAQQENRLKVLEAKLNQSEQLIAEREKLITEKEKQLSQRGKELDLLQQEVATLEQYYQDYQELRQGNVRLLRGQVLASGVFRIVDPTAARSVVDQLLSQANRSAIQRTKPGDNNFKEQVIVIRETEVKQLIDTIDDGNDYVVRIISAGNYVLGESPVQVFADVAPNRVIFKAGEVLAATSADPSKMTEEQLRQRIELLIAASQYRARRAGIVANTMQIGDDRIETLTRFLEQLKQSKQPVDVQVVASDTTYTAGPVKMDLVAIQGGQVIFRTTPTG
ncbi:DUF3084 domain-containing protein [Phormidium sp. LEGE 05292]|uniref:DUF3084 domain-containing protein n=1 Tax=[Phormidium] sp. LEGE 05292 TaxID=767427 RepID=UPI00187E34A8|nr:DUF3084 domain-containing protein [Phormidium sp. LEGE 05292]MBE9225717.1 DUF3084 domain-containing protein [Phormidium sp. LEGE 05292]